MKKIVVLISGRGSNLAALIKAARAERWREEISAEIVSVFSNRPDAAGLDIAKAHGIETTVIENEDFPFREAFDAALMQAIDRHQPAVVILAGFLRMLTPAFVHYYEGRMINIHPSLLPSFGGLKTHRQALETGVRIHGATVHFVNTALDSGAIIAQAAVPVKVDDDEQSLAARVLEQEHLLLPRVTRWLLQERVRLCEGRVQFHDVASDELAVFAG